MKGYKQEMKEFLKTLGNTLTPAEKREALEGWKAGYWAAQESHEPRPYEGVKDAMIVTSGDFDPRDVLKATTRTHPKVTPFELDPEYRSKQEREHGEGEIKGIKQYPITLEDEPIYSQPNFSNVKSRRLREAAEVLKFGIGFDRKSNRHVLYSPLSSKAISRMDRAAQAMWLRSIGMPPKTISKLLSISYDTVKTWLRTLKGNPLVNSSAADWGTGYDSDGKKRYFSSTSSVDAPKHQYPAGDTDLTYFTGD